MKHIGAFVDLIIGAGVEVDDIRFLKGYIGGHYDAKIRSPKTDEVYAVHLSSRELLSGEEKHEAVEQIKAWLKENE